MDAPADDDEFSFRLVPSSDEPAINTPEGQARIAALTNALRGAGAKPVTRGMVFDSVGGGGFQLPEFTILLEALAGPVSFVIATWIHAARGRKCVIKTKDYTVQAPTVTQAASLAETQHALMEAAKKGKKTPKKSG